MTSTMRVEVENIKCGGCERSILKGLAAIDGISDVVVDRDQQTIQFTGPEPLRDIVAEKLRSMGYPEKGSLQGLDAGLANAKSFVSCAIGRVS
jgi:copper chaperone